MHFWDILIVSIIGILALAYLAKTIIKMRKNKCATMCNGCGGDTCSTKSFAATKPIKFHKLEEQKS